MRGTWAAELACAGRPQAVDVRRRMAQRGAASGREDGAASLTLQRGHVAQHSDDSRRVHLPIDGRDGVHLTHELRREGREGRPSARVVGLSRVAHDAPLPRAVGGRCAFDAVLEDTERLWEELKNSHEVSGVQRGERGREAGRRVARVRADVVRAWDLAARHEVDIPVCPHARTSHRV